MEIIDANGVHVGTVEAPTKAITTTSIEVLLQASKATNSVCRQKVQLQ